MRICAIILIFCLVSPGSHGQSIIPVVTGPQASFRGLSVVNDQVAWVSGSKGTVGRTTDGGKTWTWIVIPGYEKSDFRSIYAMDGKTVVTISVASPAHVLKTNDGGNNWKEVFKDTAGAVFIDAIAGDRFNGDSALLAVGDPIDGKVYAIFSEDQGETWEQISGEYRPKLLPGEAFFASSSTNIRLPGEGYRLVSGGEHSRFFSGDFVSTLPLVQGKQSTGANSVAAYDSADKERLVVVGGDFTADTVTTGNCAYSLDRGKTWKVPETPPHGYRSCVEFLDDKRLIACGTSGVDVSEDGGVHWRLISKDSYHVVRMAKNGKAVFLAGGGGRLARLVW